MLNEALHISRECGFDIIRQAFVLCPNVDFIIWLCPVNYITTDFVDNTFSVLDLEYSDERKKIAVGVPTGSKVLFLHRSNFLSKLFVREARVEDNDDLLPILRTSNPDVVAGQEDFFLAELIQQQDDRNHFFVGLDNNQIVGMLATSLDVNVSLLLRIFDFDAFPDVIIQRIQRPPPPPLLVGLLGDIRLINFDEMCEALADKDCVFVNASDIILDSNDRDASNEEKNSADFPDTILKYIRSMESQGTVKAQPSAYLIYGYPRDENEAYDNLREVFSFDYLLQLENTNEDDEEDEDDEVLQNHLDAVEVLKENFRPTEGPVFPEWLKVSMDSSEDGKAMNIHHLATEVDKILKKRADAIIYQKKLDDEQPPEANAFAVTVFCMDEEFTSRSNDLLKIAFEDHPRHDYCLFMVPNAKSSSAITQTMTFVRTRAGLSFDQSLFLMHRSAFVAQQFMRIERFSLKSSKELRFFVDKMPKNDGLEMIKRCEQIVKENSGVELKDNPSEVVFLATINSLVVGVFIISRKALSNDDTTWFRANYQLDSIVNFENYRSRSQAIVQHWIIDPIYSKCSKSILREIMRQYGKLLLYYHADMTYTPEKEILEEFIHVPPRSLREQVSGGEAVEYSKKPSSEGSEAKSPLFVITKKMLSKAKDIVCKRVVVVGGTSHAMAALDTILSVPYLYFPNVFLVLDYLPQPMRIHAKPSLHDHYTGKLPDALAPYEYNGCLSVNQVDFPTERELYARGLAHKVRIVRGKLTDIDRENKAVVVSDEVVVEYDLLLIASNTKGTLQLPLVN